nr:uridine kinase [Marinifaba aquimaris]
MNSNKVTIIAISGASASGKTLLTDAIIAECNQEMGQQCISVLREDAYYKDQSHLSLEQRKQINYDHPDAFDHVLLIKHLKLLKTGREVAMPVYDYQAHNRSTQTQTVQPSCVIVVEGILLLAVEALLTEFDIKVFMDTPLDICLMRRIKRDMAKRGRDIDSIMQQYLTSVRPMFFQFIQPSRENADVIVTRGGENRMAKELLKGHILGLLQ